MLKVREDYFKRCVAEFRKFDPNIMDTEKFHFGCLYIGRLMGMMLEYHESKRNYRAAIDVCYATRDAMTEVKKKVRDVETEVVMNFMIATVNGCIENLYRFTEAMFGASRN